MTARRQLSLPLGIGAREARLGRARAAQAAANHLTPRQRAELATILSEMCRVTPSGVTMDDVRVEAEARGIIPKKLLRSQANGLGSIPELAGDVVSTGEMRRSKRKGSHGRFLSVWVKR